MALPAAITTASVRFGQSVSYTGAAASVVVTIKPTHTVFHAATGRAIVPFTEAASAAAGAEASIALPHTDQDGFVDGAGNAFKNWAYVADGTYTLGQTKISFRKTFQIPTGQDVIDLDLVPDGTVAAPVTGGTATVLSVAGFTGAVTAVDLAAPVAEAASGEIAANAAIEAADQRLALEAYRQGGYDVTANVALSGDWIVVGMSADGRTLYGAQEATATLGWSTNDGASFTVAKTFAQLVQAVLPLASGELLVAIQTGGGVYQLHRSTGWPANPAAATWTQVHTGQWNAYGSYPSRDYGGLTRDKAGHVWAADYGKKTNVAATNSTQGAVRVFRSSDGGSTWSQVFKLDDWLAGRGFDPLTTGFHLHGVAWDEDWERLWLSYGDTSGTTGESGVLYSDDLGSTWNIAFQTNAGAAWQTVAIAPMPYGVVLFPDGQTAATYVLRRTGYREFSAPEVLLAVNNGTPNGAIGRMPFRASFPGAPLLIPITHQATVTAGASMSSLQATADGRRAYHLLKDPTAETAGFRGLMTAVGPTASGKIVGSRKTGAGIQTFTLTLRNY